MSKYIRLSIMILFAVGIVCCGNLSAQDQVQMSTFQGESYLDGFEIENIVDLEEIDIDVEQQVLSYLDSIDHELRDLEKYYLSGRVVGGLYGSFHECVETAIQNHLPIQIARDKIDLGKRKLIRAVRDLFPSVNLRYHHDKGFKLYKTTGPGGQPSQQFRSEQWRTSFAQTLFNGGALWNQVRAERAHLYVARDEYKKVYQDLTVEVARAYYHLVKAETMLSYKENLLASSHKAVFITEEKMAAELISEIEHLNVQSLYSQIQHDAQAGREEVALAVVDFKKVLYLDIHAPVGITTWTDDDVEGFSREVDKKGQNSISTNATEQETKLDELLKLAYQNRPEFAIQRHKLEAATWMEKVAHAGWLPKVQFVAEFGQKAEQYKVVDNNPPWDEEHHIGLQVAWNFGGSTAHYVYDKDRQGAGVEATDINVAMDGYYDRRNVASIAVLDDLEQFSKTKEAEISREEAMLELELSEKDVVSDVKESYYNYNRASIQVRSVLKRLAYRKKLVELARHRSEINEIQLSEFTQTQIDLVNEREALYQAIVDHEVAKVALNKSIGIRDYLNTDKS